MYKAPCCAEWLLITLHFCRALTHMILSNPMGGGLYCTSFIDDITLRLRRTLPNASVRNKRRAQPRLELGAWESISVVPIEFVMLF